MSQDLVRRMKNVLNSQYYFMNNDWLSDCIQFYLGQDNNPQDQQIINFVKSQWELSDLREINNENGCLPQNLSQQKVTTLRGTYILQMEKIYDAATSKYKQLEQIRNVSTANIEVTENEEKQFWEPKKRRMLYLYLTDGIQDITAMEYEPIRCLTDSVLPGRKVVIVGPIRCRRGVILLQQGKFKELGGEVENLLIPNFVENVLARALGLPENPDPYNNSDNKDVNNDKDVNEADFFEDEFDIDLEQVSEIERRSQELESNHHIQSTQLSTLDPPAAKRKKQDQNMNKVLEFNDEDLIEIIEDDEIYCPVSKEPVSQKQNTGLSTSKRMNSGNNNQKCSVAINADNINAVEDAFADDFDIDNIDTVLCDAASSRITREKEVTPTLKKCTDNPKSGRTHPTTSETSQFNKVFSVTPSTSTSRITKPEPAVSKNLSSVEMTQKTLNEVTPGISSNKKLSISSPGTKVSKILSSQEERKGVNGNKKILEFIGKASGRVKPDLPKICDFICDIVAQNITETTFCTVRGRTVSLGKLSKKDQCWQLNGTITDQTASIDVTFSSQVLEDIIGLSVKQFSEKRKLAKSNPALDQELRMFCRNAELKLKQMDALMELEISGPDTKWKVVTITPLTENQKEIIDERLKMLKL